jgi:hypothetical protein
MKRFWLSCAVLLLLSLPQLLNAQCALSCNNQVNVSIPAIGFAIIEPDMILEGQSTACAGPQSVTVYNPAGIPIGDSITCEFLQKVLVVNVSDLSSGNSCWGSILVQDKQPPVITCQDTTVSCAANLSAQAIGFPLVIDNCDNQPALSFSEVSAPMPCSSPYVSIVTRTWQSTDASGNAAIPCQQLVYVKKPLISDVVFPLNLDNIHSPSLDCGNNNTAPSFTGYPEIEGAPVVELCKINTSYHDQQIAMCGNAYAIIRKWTLLDWCSGEVAMHTQLIKVEDKTPPMVTCADTLTVSTNGPDCAGTFFLPPAQASDACSNPLTFRTFLPQLMLEGNGGLVFSIPVGVHTLTYEAKDACLNTGVCHTILQVKDDVPPVAICDGGTVVSLNSNGEAELPAQKFDEGSYDQCCAVNFLARRAEDTSAAFSPGVLFTCEDLSDTILVLLRAADCIGNANFCMSSVIVQEKIPPAIACPAPVSLACDSPQPLPLSLTGEPTVTENCTIDTLFFTDSLALNMCHSGSVFRRFTAIDATGLQASCTQLITLVDTTASQFYFPPDTTVDCSKPLDSIEAGQALALSDCEFFGLNVSDEVFSLSCGLKIFRTYTFQDWCSGLDTSYTQKIIVEDINPPVWQVAPGALDKLYLCEGDFVKPLPPPAIDYCSPYSVDILSDETIPGASPNDFTRILTFIAADSCGNVAAPYVVTIVVKDTVPPTANPLPDLGPYACYDDRPVPNILQVTGETDNCTGAVSVSFVSETGDPGCFGIVEQVYSVKDLNGNETLLVQYIEIKDTIAPTALPLEPLGPYACEDNIPPPNTALVIGESDNCGGPVAVDFAGESGSVNCTGLIKRRYRLTDECGNERILTQDIIIQDTVPPSISWSDTIIATIPGLSCETYVGVSASAQDNCPGRTVTISNDFNDGGDDASDFYPAGQTVVNFTATDECGNSTTVQTVVIVRDLVSPSVSCSAFELMLDSSGVAVVPVQQLIEAGILGTEDLCSVVTVHFSPDTLDCSYLITEPTIIDYVMVVTDEFGNTDSCSGDLVLYDPFNTCLNSAPLVAGMVYNEKFQPMVNVQVMLQDGLSEHFTFTGINGGYQFGDVALGSNTLVKPLKNDDLLNGVTTFDLVLLTRHILGTQLLDSPYKIIAADANRSGSVSTYDAVILRKAILQVVDEFPNNNSWRFIRSSHDFSDPANPFLDFIPEFFPIAPQGYDAIMQSFVAIKVGDLNGSAAPGLDSNPQERGEGRETLLLMAESKRFKAGETVGLPVLAGSSAVVSALQFTLEIDPAFANIERISSTVLSGFGEENYALHPDGSITLSWDDIAGQQLEYGAELFNIEMSVHKDMSLEQAAAISSAKTPAVAYENNGNPLNIGWRIHEQPAASVDAARLFSLEQNRPNPFSGSTVLAFFLAERMPVRLELLDVNGRTQVLREEMMDAGWQELEVSEEMPIPGIYFCQLVTPHGTERRKMVKQ